MTREEESEEIRALLREAHRDDERSCPPFQQVVRDGRARSGGPRRRVGTAAAVAALAAAASVLAVVSFRAGRPAAVAQPPALARPVVGTEAPLDFLLQLPKPAPRDPLASLRPPRSSGSDSKQGR
jgi:hypothetical protein